MTMLNIWRKWEEDGFTTSFAFDNLLNIKVLREVGQVRDQLLKILGENSSDDNRHKEHEDLTEEEKITKCLLTSRPNNIFFEVLRRKYPTYDMAMVGTNIKDVSVFPGSVSFKTDSKFFIGEDVYTNDKGATYVRKCHNLTLDKIKKLIPHMVVREKEGEPQKSFYTGQVTQNYVIKINGVVATRDYEVVGDVGGSVSFLYRNNVGRYASTNEYRNQSMEAHLDAYTLAYDIETKVLDSGITLRQHNENVIEKLRYYKSRNRELTFSLPNGSFVIEKIKSDMSSGLIPKDLDIDCLSKEIKDSPIKESHMIPPVAGAIKYILVDVNTEIKNKKIVIIGYGKLVGEPVYKWFLKNNINPKIIDIKTEENIKKELYKEADIVISGVGIPNLLTGNYFKKDVIIIDAGTSEQSGVITGDCDPSCKDIASIITPVPGGVGPLTVACLFKNLIEKYN